MKCKYRLVFFDLDGTLTNSGPGIIDCVRRTIRHMNCPELPLDTLRRFIGPPTWNGFRMFCGLSPEDTRTAVAYFRRIYDAEGVFNNSVYDGIPELLDGLREAGAKLAVATSKPHPMAHKVLDHYGLAPKFDYISSADESDQGDGKEKLILPVLHGTGVFPEDAVMIGDTKYDAAGARRAGVDFLGVLYGFGTEEEMRREGAVDFSRTVDGLYGKLLDKRQNAVV